jgi:hypothetical protein
LARVNMLVTRKAQTKIEPWLSTDCHFANSLLFHAQVNSRCLRGFPSSLLVWSAHAKTGRLQFVQHTPGKFSPRRKTKQVMGYIKSIPSFHVWHNFKTHRVSLQRRCQTVVRRKVHSLQCTQPNVSRRCADRAACSGLLRSGIRNRPVSCVAV